MHHGCYKLCPKVREQQRKAREAREKSKATDGSSCESIGAGPSGLQKSTSRLDKRRANDGSDYPSGTSSPSRIKSQAHRGSDERLRNRDRERKKYGRSGKSHESLPSKNEEVKKPVYSSESYESLRSRDRERKKRDYSKKSYESLRKQDAGSSTRRDSRKYVNKVESLARDKRRKEEIRTSGPVSPKTSGIASERKMHKASESSQIKRREYPVRGRSDEKNVLKPETSRKKDEAGPSRIDDRREDKRSKKDTKIRENCDRNCRGINEKTDGNGNEEEQEAFDQYIINKSICYFEDLCNCHYACLLDQLWRDSFFRSTIASTIIFAIGIKLCSEMDGWRIPF